MNNISNESIREYCLSHSAEDDQLLQELTEHTSKTTESPGMISGSEVGNLLQLLITLNKSKSILEIGTFTGYSALKMAAALPAEGSLHTCEMDNKHYDIAKSFFDRSEFGSMIIQHKGAALDTLKSFQENQFDFAFIDADKINYPNYYETCTTLIKPGGVIVLDNMLWSGTVINPEDDDAKALRSTGDIIQNDPPEHLLPVRDGLMVCIRNT